MPEDIEFKTKPQIALEQIRSACEAGLPRGVVIIDAGYGVEAKFRSEISALRLKYVAGVKTTNTVWAPDTFACGKACARIAKEQLEDNSLARWHERDPLLALRPCQGPLRARSLCCDGNGCRGVALD